MSKHYVIYTGSHGGHSACYLVGAPTVLEAVWQFILDQDSDVIREQGGTLRLRTPRLVRAYPHPLAYVEANYKCREEWQIREVRQQAWGSACEELICSEDPRDVTQHINQCRPLLRGRFPGSRASAFIWYVQQGVLVTFYRRTRAFEIDVVQRYLVPNDQDHPIQEWVGNYDELLDQLYLRWWKDDDQERLPRTQS
jgi:hypothetical protein